MVQQVVPSESARSPKLRERHNPSATVAISLAGCDFGTSGIGVFARQVIPRFVDRLRRRRCKVLLIRTRRERQAFNSSWEEGTLVPGTVHDLAQFDVPNKNGSARQLYMVLTPMLRRLAVITAVSEATATDIVTFAGVYRSRIRVIPNGVTVRERCRIEGPQHARRYSWDSTAEQITAAMTEMLNGTT